MTEQEVLDLLTIDKYKEYLNGFGDIICGIVGSGFCDGAYMSEPLCAFIYDRYNGEISSVEIDENNRMTLNAEEKIVISLPQWAVEFQDRIVKYSIPEEGTVTALDCIDVLDGLC